MDLRDFIAEILLDHTDDESIGLCSCGRGYGLLERHQAAALIEALGLSRQQSSGGGPYHRYISDWRFNEVAGSGQDRR